MSGTNSILFVDAYDSFSNNIVALLHSCIPAANIVVVHIDTNVKDKHQVDTETFIRSFQVIVLGPGPGHPANKPDVGLFEDVWQAAERYHIPVLGICLGFQTLCIRNGYKIARMHMPCHGQTKAIRTSNQDIFTGLEDVCAMNYNSLAIRKNEFDLEYDSSRPGSSGTDSSTSSRLSDFVSIGSCEGAKYGQLQLLAWDDDGYVMAVRHRSLPFWGFQFHPESCMSQGCDELIKRWWSKTQQYNEMYRPRELDTSIFRRLETQVRIQQSPSTERSLYGRVIWQMLTVKGLTLSHISDLCYSLGGTKTTAMLESTAKGRFSIYAFTDDASELLTYHDGRLMCSSSGQTVSATESTSKEALEYLERKIKASACIGGCSKIPFWGGLIGYLSYEMGLDLLNVPSKRSRDVPDFNFVGVDRSIVFDNQTNDVCIQSIRSDDEIWVEQMKLKLQKMDKEAAGPRNTADNQRLSQILQSAEKFLPDHDQYTASIEKCQENLHAGQSYELCLTGEATIDLPNLEPETSYDLYKNLRKHNPVPYAAYLQFPDPATIAERNLETTILSSSPELFLSQSRTGTMDMIPMKGTVQRTATTTIDDAMKILYTPKETAENLMIADLIRHDLYAVVGTKPYPWFTSSPNPTVKPQYHFLSSTRQLPSQDEEENSHTITTNPQSQPQSPPTRNPLSIPALNTIQTYETVYQLTSHIRAHPPPHLFPTPEIPPDPHAIISHNHRALHHTLPPGSMTGAPKKRSCEILQTLEQRNRGVYSGVIGYMCVSGATCWSVAIRTAWSTGKDEYVRGEEVTASTSKTTEGSTRVINRHKAGGGSESENIATMPQAEPDDSGWHGVQTKPRKVWHVGAGGAITVLSDVEGEWEEMMGKMRNVVKGLTVAAAF